MPSLTNVPESVERRLIEVLNRSRRAVISVGKSGRIRVFSFSGLRRKSARMREVIRRHRPWEARRKPPLGAMGTQALGIKGSVRRVEIYGIR